MSVASRRPLLVRVGIAFLVAFLVAIPAGFSFVEWSVQPGFCLNCHLMIPYYKSWEDSAHGKKQVSCVQCHYEPGIVETMKGKVMALNMVVKYATGAEGTKPWAQVSDASCMRGGCHSQRLLAGAVKFDMGRVSIPFNHTPHLLEMRGGKKLRCTSCHSQIVQGEHLSVTVTTCFTCHFKGAEADPKMGDCRTCHGPPEKPIDLGGFVFEHEAYLERGVTCESCHPGTTVGTGEVPEKRCLSCHGVVEHLQRYGETEFIHAKHVTTHKVDCLQCHTEITHKLRPRPGAEVRGPAKWGEAPDVVDSWMVVTRHGGRVSELHLQPKGHGLIAIEQRRPTGIRVVPKGKGGARAVYEDDQPSTTWKACFLKFGHGYHMAVEKLMDIEVPIRGQWVRVLTSELMRICDHQTCLAATCMELGAFTAFLYLIKGRELLWEILERLCGARVTTSYSRIGGLTDDLYPDFEAQVRQAIRDCRDINSEVNKLMTGNRIFIDRTKGIGALSRQDCISYGFTGPMARAAGIEVDVRAHSPYLTYGQLDFEIPLCSNGDCYDRYLVRFFEMEQSLRMIEQCFQKMPKSGPVSVEDYRITPPPKEKVYTRIEELMAHFKHHMWGHMIAPPAGQVYHAVEGGNGELGFYLVSTGEERPWKVRCRPPC
ncbi:MAG: NapC/NirT family cytochrome c, partial [Planctomycetaceae bacterium]|nr:NapC/NirT family cytochrome c [Planctomycetaceae bacterium]